MNRLTEKDGQGNWCLKGLPWKCLRIGEVITTTAQDRLYGALCKLMRYEDTGLSPEQIEQMDELYREKCKEVARLKDRLAHAEDQWSIWSEAYQKDVRVWIPVEEQLPGLDEVVLVQVSGKPAENIMLYDAVELAEYNPDDGLNPGIVQVRIKPLKLGFVMGRW